MISRLDSSHVSTIEALPMTLDHNENSRVFISKTRCMTASRCGKDSAVPIPKMRPTTSTIDSRGRQRPVILMITSFLADSSDLGFVPTNVV
ncbi:hypothetical protein MTO96_024742 [Rhipicephalus appendiculatus]